MSLQLQKAECLLRMTEVVLSESFARANHLLPGKKSGGNLRRKKKVLNVVGIALSSEFVYIFRSSSPYPIQNTSGFYG